MQAFVTAAMRGARWGMQNPTQATALSQKILPDIPPEELAAGIQAFGQKQFWNVDGLEGSLGLLTGRADQEWRPQAGVSLRRRRGHRLHQNRRGQTRAIQTLRPCYWKIESGESDSHRTPRFI